VRSREKYSLQKGPDRLPKLVSKDDLKKELAFIKYLDKLDDDLMPTKIIKKSHT